MSFSPVIKKKYEDENCLQNLLPHEQEGNEFVPRSQGCNRHLLNSSRDQRYTELLEIRIWRTKQLLFLFLFQPSLAYFAIKPECIFVKKHHCALCSPMTRNMLFHV